MAKPHLVKCELTKGKDIEVPEIMKSYERYMPDDDYVLVACENGHTYKINVTGNSLIAIASVVFKEMTYK